MNQDELTSIKAEARKRAFARRKAAHSAEASEAAQGHLQAILAEYSNQSLAGYMPIRTEVDPVAVMAAHSGLVGVPVIQAAGQPLVFHQWSAACPMKDGPFGASVPENGVKMVPDVLIVPLVAFDTTGGRLGYGGGFYDRTLEGLRQRGPVVAIGYAYQAQQAKALPLEPTDQPLDMIVTDAGVLRF
ncbi:MAG: 5-formyltetrahydrofolate cyclo-ligase [Pseudoruegeria sp.]